MDSVPSSLLSTIERDTQAFIDAVIEPGVQFPPHKLYVTCDMLYDGLLQFLLDQLAETLVKVACSQGMNAIDGDQATSRMRHFVIGEEAYTLHVNTPVGRPHEVAVVIVGTGHGVFSDTLILDYRGRFGSAHVEIPSGLAALNEYVCAVTRCILDTGDRCIEQSVLTQIFFDTSGAISTLYSLLRRNFDRATAETIRLYVLDPKTGGGMHLDAQAGTSSFETLKHSVDDRDPSGPAERLLRLAVARFPTEESVASEIVPALRTVTRSPLQIPSGRHVGLIQEQVFGDAIVLQPLVNSDKLWIEAGYPARHRSTIEPVLENQRTHFADVALRLDLSTVLEVPEAGEADSASMQQHIERIIRVFGRFTATVGGIPEGEGRAGSGAQDYQPILASGPSGLDERSAPKSLQSGGGKGINGRMLDTLQKNPEARGWTTRQWAYHLSCSPSSIHGTTTWAELSAMRKVIAADKAVSKRHKS